MEDDTLMNEKKDRIIDAILNKENILLHSGGGTGKSYLIREITKELLDITKTKFACTATTGIAALNINVPEKKIFASTLHRWSGTGLARESAEKLVGKVEKDPQAKRRWCETDLLIIDEVSMLGAEFFDKLDYIGRRVRGNLLEPFGGLRLFMSGDFLQLPPVKDGWVFSSRAFKELDITPFNLTEPKRYDDIEYFNMLLRIREGTHTRDDEKKLIARHKAYLDLIKNQEVNERTILPTVIFSKKVDVESHNTDELDRLETPIFENIAADTFKRYTARGRFEYYENLLNETIPKSVILKEGAQVMLKYNMDVKSGLVNGSRGVITHIDSVGLTIRVLFLNGSEHEVGKHTWDIEDKDGKASRTQFPLILAYAITAHKSQGMSLDLAVCDIGPSIFSDGQAYVMLSRVRNLNGLYLTDFYPPSIRANKTALKYSKKLQKLEDVDLEEYKKYLEE